MEQTTMTGPPDIEQALLAQVDLCHSVALALTRNPRQALALAEETLLWALRRDGRGWHGDNLKMALLSELRDRYRRHSRGMQNPPASSGRQLQQAGA